MTNKSEDEPQSGRKMMDDDDLDEYTEYMSGCSLNTIRQYRARINTLYTHFEKPITEIGINEFVDFCKGKGRPLGMPLNPNTSSQYINALNKYWNMKDLVPQDFIDYRKDVLDGDIQKHTRKTNDALRAALPTYESVLKNEADHKKHKNVKEYLLCYLCREFFTRNMDLDVQIVSDRKDVNKDGNFLLVQNRPNRIEYIRNKYKTFSKYGTKTFTIKEKAIYKMVSELHTAKDDYLFPYRPEEQPCDENRKAWVNYESNCAKIIKRSLGGIGEGLLLKIQVNNIKNKNELLLIEERRGTSLPYLLRSYNIDAPLSSSLHESPFYQTDESEE